MACWCSSPLNCKVTSDWQETCWSSVSNFVTDGEISLEKNIWHIISAQHFWNECMDQISLAAPFLLPMLVAWILGICGRVNYMSILFSLKPSCHCVASAFLYIKHSLCIWRLREGTPPVCTWNLRLSFCTCGLSDLEYIFISRSQLEQWDLTFRRQWFVESLFLVLFKSCTHCKSWTPLPTEGWRNVPWSQV